MQLVIGGYDATQLAVSIQTQGNKKECARTLKAEILQAPEDHNFPVIRIELGAQVSFTADGQSFLGTVRTVERSTASNTVTVTAKDFGVYVVNNKISYKVKNASPASAAAELAGAYGVPVGSLAGVGFQFSRKWMGVSLYNAIMTGYALAAAESGDVYRMYFDGAAMNIAKYGDEIVAVISEGKNLMEATYSESIENLISQVDIVDKDGKITRSVSGATGYGVTREQVTLSGQEDSVAKAEEIIRIRGLERKATIKNLGNSNCTSGKAVMVQERQTGLYGLFYIESDTHIWKNGLYTNSLTLSWENTMDATAAGSVLEESSKAKKRKATETATAEVGTVDYYNEKLSKAGFLE